MGSVPRSRVPRQCSEVLTTPLNTKTAFTFSSVLGLEPGTLRFSAQRFIKASVCEKLNLMTDIVRWNQTQEDGPLGGRQRCSVFDGSSRTRCRLAQLRSANEPLWGSGSDVYSRMNWNAAKASRRVCLGMITLRYKLLLPIILLHLIAASVEKSFETESISTGLLYSITLVFGLQLFCVAGHRGIQFN